MPHTIDVMRVSEPGCVHKLTLMYFVFHFFHFFVFLSGNMDIFSFGAGGLNTFTNPRGLLFHDNVLYVCDNNRVLAFMESTAGHLILLKVFAPIHEPISLAVYKNTLAVTTRYYIFFYNLHTTIYLGSITQLGSFLITASRNYLYVADHSKICAYTQNSE